MENVLRTIVAPIAIVLAVQTVTAFATCAHGYNRKNVHIEHPWTPAKPTAPNADVVIFMTIKNSSRSADRLQRVESREAARVEIHGASGEISERGLVIPPGVNIAMKPNGAHLRLIGLKKDLIPYDTIAVELIFERAGRIRIDIIVDELPM
jgi:copper(I)-binding protein